jgi:hypothetical protein
MLCKLTTWDAKANKCHGEQVNSTPEQRVAQVVWPWRISSAASAAGVWARHWRVLLQCAVTAAIATLLTWWLGRYRMGLCVYGFSAVILICGLLAPKAFAVLERLGQKLARLLALALTWILLMPFFYLCFAPARLILALMGKDPMQRRLERNRGSYWVDHNPPAVPRPYTRQY